jgi:hypothetical protein
MTLEPTPVSAALAGAFSAVAWPWLWPYFDGQSTSGSLGFVICTLLVLALPAHAFVLGFGWKRPSGPRTVDTALLARIGAWLAAATVTAVLAAIYRAQ